jgi:hypothetical protein
MKPYGKNDFRELIGPLFSSSAVCRRFNIQETEPHNINVPKLNEAVIEELQN